MVTQQEGEIMIQTPDIQRPPKRADRETVSLSSATASGDLSRLGIRGRTHPRQWR